MERLPPKQVRPLIGVDAKGGDVLERRFWIVSELPTICSLRVSERIALF
jgi:hypothetical protein